MGTGASAHKCATDMVSVSLKDASEAWTLLNNIFCKTWTWPQHVLTNSSNKWIIVTPLV